MNEPNKDSLENFFRERAQRHNLEFNEVDWLNLEKQLDREMPVAFNFFTFLRRFWAITLLLIMIPVGWITYNSIYERRDKDMSAANVISKNSYTEEYINADDHISAAENSDDITNQTLTAESFSSSELHTYGKDNTSVEDESEVDITVDDARIILGMESEKTQEYIVEIEGEKSKRIGQVVFEEGAQSDLQVAYTGLLFLSAISPTSLIVEGSLDKPEATFEESEVVPLKSKSSYLKIGVGYSPDFSTVGIGNFVSPGSRWKVIFEYAFMKRLAINTGIVLVDNKYEAYGEDYHAPARYWKNGIVANEAYGECKMIDIPLNLRYNLLSKGKNNVFLSAGSSTYFVTKEDYYFHYDQDDPDLPDHWGTDKTTIYPFGIINLSIGYEYEIGRRAAFQLEPFIKIPTTGIGWGNVDLHTMGIYFMYKYRF